MFNMFIKLLYSLTCMCSSFSVGKYGKTRYHLLQMQCLRMLLMLPAVWCARSCLGSCASPCVMHDANLTFTLQRHT